MHVSTSRLLDFQDIAINAGGLGCESRVGQIGHMSCQRLTTAATFPRSCVAQVLSRGDATGVK